MKAEEDLAVAAHILDSREQMMAPAACFHAQQSVEKYLKAILVLRGIAFPKTHEIKKLLALMSPSDRPALSGSEEDRLTDYATVFRYPGEYEPITLVEARRTVALARRIRTRARKTLPPVPSLRRHR